MRLSVRYDNPLSFNICLQRSKKTIIARQRFTRGINHTSLKKKEKGALTVSLHTMRLKLWPLTKCKTQSQWRESWQNLQWGRRRHAYQVLEYNVCCIPRSANSKAQIRTAKCPLQWLTTTLKPAKLSLPSPCKSSSDNRKHTGKTHRKNSRE